MAFHVRDKETDALVRELALRRGVGLTEAVRLAVEGELARQGREVAEKRARVSALLNEVDAWPRTGLKADKAFFDELSGD
ncbi:transcription factor [Brevundimonas sp. LM2]|uniref:type II toxin-antitoxin system VapB family antitoxin n=1 Tax=Brevundimonas sp. LM2 TaxID=1938605 RepID=UPI000983CD62|nr:type II toxin-antitoxin system VapB family antitoxin [Brevundimonas sp. LM2]AQR61542.1 transcription factor [Brevundimonas sp. LM2]